MVPHGSAPATPLINALPIRRGQPDPSWQGPFGSKQLRDANESARDCLLPTRYPEELRIAAGTFHYNCKRKRQRTNAKRLFVRGSLSYLLNSDALQLQRVRGPMASDMRPFSRFLRKPNKTHEGRSNYGTTGHFFKLS